MNFNNVLKQYTTVQDLETLTDLVDSIKSTDVISLDTETTSLNVRKSTVIGISIATAPGRSFYIPTFKYNPDLDKLEELYIEGESCDKIAKKVVKLLVGKKLITHNGSFDCQTIDNYYGVDLVPYIYIETTLLVHTVNEEGAFGFGSPFALKSIAKMVQKEIGLDVEEEANKEQLELKESIKKNGGSTTQGNFEIYKADLEVLCRYAAADADLTLRIAFYYLEVLKSEKLEKFFFEDEVMPLYKEVTIPMERKGVRLDIDLMKKTREEIQEESKKIESRIIKELIGDPRVQEWVLDKALDKFPPKPKGKWAEELINHYKIIFPVTKRGLSITKKTVALLEEGPLKSYLTTGDLSEIDAELAAKLSLKLWKEFNKEYINIQSKSQMAEIVFKCFGEKSISKTEKGQDQFDEDVIEALSSKYTWMKDLHIYNKYLKISSTYIDRFLDNAEDGRFYPYFKQHGTVSGRYGSDLQQLPKPLEEGEEYPEVLKYRNIVRKFIISDPGYCFIDSDYVSLEPKCFASVSGDQGLQDIFKNGWDFYSTVAIQTENLHQYSPDPSAPNFLKKLDPVKRNKAKSYSLGVAYGMESYALGMTLNISQKEAEKLIEGYFQGFPNLYKWKVSSRNHVKEYGYIKNKLGRIRHLPKVRDLYGAFGDGLLDWKTRTVLVEDYGKDEVMKWYKDYKNGLNNCLNFQLQSLAAAIVNRSAIQINRELKKRGIDGQVVAQIHDQLVILVPEDKAEECMEFIQDLMENTVKLPGVDLTAPPQKAYNLLEGH